MRRHDNLLSIFCLLLATAAVEASFRSLPLVPHRVQQERRRRLLEFHGLNTTLSEGRVERRSRLSTDRSLRAQQVGALYQGYGTHYVDLWCGSSHPQRQTVIVDTGSAVTAFPCSGCRDHCGKDYHIDQVFEESMSDTFETLDCNDCMRGRCTVASGAGKNNNCKIGMSYQEGSSWTAFEASDYCYIGGPHGRPLELKPMAAPEEPETDVDEKGISTADIDPELAAGHAFRLVFGCQTKLTGLFKTQLADGIMGMDNAHESFWHQMSAAGQIDEDIFTLCFARQPSADRKGTEAGAMTLGGVDTRLHTSPLVYASVGVSNAFYGVHIRNVYLREGGGGDSATSTNPDLKVKRVDISEADLNRGTTIVDSGTTDTYFTRNIASAFHSLWKDMTGKSYNNNPVSMTEEQINQLPTILFQLQGLTDVNQKLSEKEGNGEPMVGLVGDIDPEHPYDVLLAMPPSHYMEYDTDLKKYVPRFYTDEGRGSVLGANVMMGHNIVFDQVNGRLGIAESHCDYADLVSSLGFDWNVHEEYNKADHMGGGEGDSDTEEEKEEEEEEEEEKAEDEEVEHDKAKPKPKGDEKPDDEEDSKFLEAPGPDGWDDDTTISEGGAPLGAGFCTSPICQGGIVGAALVALLAGVLVRSKMKKSVDRGIPIPYSSELELQGQEDADAGEFGHYRDDVDDDDDDEFQDEDIE